MDIFLAQERALFYAYLRKQTASKRFTKDIPFSSLAKRTLKALQLLLQFGGN